MKPRALAIMLCFCVLLSLSGCGKPDIVGDNLVMQAREDFGKLNSAEIVMTNTDTDKVEQVFTFKYSKNGVLTYKDWKLIGGEESIEFNNGETNVYLQGGKYYQYNEGDEKFVKYTRSKKHQKTQDAMLTYIPSAITDAKMERVGGKDEVTHIYDVSKVSPTVPEGATATGFAVRFVFNKSGKLDYFIETTLYEQGGKERRIAYKTQITQKNKVDEIENIISEGSFPTSK